MAATLSQPSDPPTWHDVMQLAGRDLGQDDWGTPVLWTAWANSLTPTLTILNGHASGSALVVRNETNGATLFEVSNALGPTASSLTLSGQLVANGDVTLGNASGDTLTVNATSTFVAGATFNGSVALGNAAGDAIQIDGTPTISTLLVMSATASRIVPGATSFAINNHADSAANLLITDAGAATIRAGLTITAGGLTVTAGNLAVSAGTITASSTVQGTQLISTVATGTAPLSVASTTEVANLNVARLQGHPASDFLTGLTGAVLTDGSSQTKLGALTIQGAFSTEGNTTIGNASADTLTVNATSTFNTTATFTGDVFLGNASGDNISVGGSLAITADATLGSGVALRAVGSIAHDVIAMDGADNLNLGDTGVDVTVLGDSFTAHVSGNDMIQVNSTGIGVFGSTPIARPTVSGSRGGNAALADLCSELANLGLIIDSTTV